MSKSEKPGSEIPDLFAFGGYRLSDEEMKTLLHPPAAVVGGHAGGRGSVVASPASAVVVKPRRASALARRTELLVRLVREEGRYGAKVAVLQAVVQRVWEGLMREGVCRLDKVEYVGQLAHYPHVTHCDFVLTEVDKKGFVEVVGERFVREFMKANGRAEGMWFVVPVPPAAVEFGRLFEFGGVVMRGVCDYDVRTDQRIVRLDCMWAVETKESLICQTQAERPLIGMESGDGQTQLDLMIRRRS